MEAANDVESIKVSSKSNPSSVAGMISSLVKTKTKQIEVFVVGASAVNQAIKAIAIARGFVAPLGINLLCIPTFTQIDVDGLDRTGIKLLIVKGE